MHRRSPNAAFPDSRPLRVGIHISTKGRSASASNTVRGSLPNAAGGRVVPSSTTHTPEREPKCVTRRVLVFDARSAEVADPSGGFAFGQPYLGAPDSFRAPVRHVAAQHITTLTEPPHCCGSPNVIGAETARFPVMGRILRSLETKDH